MREPRTVRPPVDRSAFAGFRFPPEMITLAVRWYLRDGLSYCDVEELLAERGIALDAYEVLRQLIDATDELEGVLLVVLVPPELVTDELRGLPAYSALQLRVADEVRDRRRPNPYAAMVRLGVRLEAVR